MESEQVEWKQSWKPKYMATLAAFASGEGGKMIIGKCNDGSVIGVRDVRDLLKVIPDTVSNKLGIDPVVRHIVLEGKDCIEITIERQKAPVSYEQRFYVRSGSTTREIAGEALRILLIKSMDVPWTDGIAKDVELSDISAEAVRDFVLAGKACGRVSKDADENDVEGTLKKFKLMTKEGITIAGALLFHHDPNMVLTDANIKIGLFSRENKLLLDDMIEGPVIGQPEEASKMLRLRYAQPRYDIEGVYRVEKYRYPPKALREALLNAAVHRAYYMDGEITVRVYEDRVEIHNPGHLPKGWTVEDLMREHNSQSPNKSMARVFYTANAIERWGSGIGTMQEECRKNGNPDPEFRIEEGGIRVIFRPNGVVDDDGVRQPAKRILLSENEQVVFNLIDLGTADTLKGISENCDIPYRTVRRVISRLKEYGIVESVGAGKYVRFKVIGVQ